MTEEQKLLEAAQKIAVALNWAEDQEFHVIVDEDGDGGVTVWSADQCSHYAEAERSKNSGRWATRAGSPA